MKSALRIENLSYMYGDQSILKRVSFSVSQGETVIIIGPNGAGKTTLIKLLLGMVKPREGQIDLLQTPLGTYSPKLLVDRSPLGDFPRITVVPDKFVER